MDSYFPPVVTFLSMIIPLRFLAVSLSSSEEAEDDFIIKRHLISADSIHF